jgi:hypothetical protein
MPTAWKDRKRPTMRNTKPIASVDVEIIELANVASQRQGMSRAAYISSLVRRDAGRSSGLGVSLWPAAVTLSRVLALLSFAKIANDRDDNRNVSALIDSASTTLGNALVKMREPLTDVVAQRLRIAGGGDVWGSRRRPVVIGTLRGAARRRERAQCDLLRLGRGNDGQSQPRHDGRRRSR